ncbi:MAG: Hsp20/alpha crystallin family protein [Pseudomonadota bacterium]
MTAQPAAQDFLPTLRRSATSALAPIRREFDRLFDEFGSSLGAFADFDVAPRLDMVETKDGVTLTFELPGIAQNDVKIDVEDNVLTVSGEKKVETQRKDDHYRVAERAYGAFSRTIALPRTIDADRIAATMADGVLTISAPKRDGVAVRTVKIAPAKAG